MMACVCILYRVGSRDEKENKTGLAHLFEHLMFSNCGKDVDFDEIMQNAGGESNAFTTPDTTQYYNIAPSSQLELMLQLEAHRMNGFKIKRKEFEMFPLGILLDTNQELQLNGQEPFLYNEQVLDLTRQ